MNRFKLKLIMLVGLLALIGAVVGSWWYNKDRRLIALAKNVYYEALLANEPEISSRMVAHVTGVRAKQNKRYFGGSDIRDVVYARKKKKNGVIVCQFSWTCIEAANREPSKRHLWESALRIAKDELAGKFVPPPHLFGADFYLNVKYSGRRNICEFKTERVYLGKAESESQHEFFRTATVSERAKLPKKSEVEECKPPKPKKIKRRIQVASKKKK
jgi:hypothetical protein